MLLGSEWEYSVNFKVAWIEFFMLCWKNRTFCEFSNSASTYSRSLVLLIFMNPFVQVNNSVEKVQYSMFIFQKCKAYTSCLRWLLEKLSSQM